MDLERLFRHTSISPFSSVNILGAMSTSALVQLFFSVFSLSSCCVSCGICFQRVKPSNRGLNVGFAVRFSDVRRGVRSFRYVLVGVSGLVAANSHAFTTEYVSQQQMTRVNVPTIGGPGWAARATGSAIEAARASSIAGPGGSAVAADVSVALSKRGIAAIAGRAIAAAGPYGAAAAGAALAIDLYKAFRGRETPAGGVEQDEGREPATEGAYEIVGGPNGDIVYQGTTAESACRAWAGGVSALVEAATPGRTFVLRNAGASGVACWYDARILQANPVGPATVIFDGVSPGPNAVLKPVLSCGIDQRYTPGGVVVRFITPDYDGKCPTGAYTRQLTSEEAAQLAAVSNSNKSTWQWKQVLEAAFQIGPVPMPLPTTNDVSYNVKSFWPSSVPGPSSETATPTQIQTVANNFSPSYRPGQGNFSVGWRQQTTTTTQQVVDGVPTGAPQTQTTTINPPSYTGAPGDVGVPVGESVDFCLANPDRAGCVALGTAPALATPTSQVSMSFTAESVSLGAASCPGVYPLGDTYSVDLTMMCTAMSMSKPVVLALALAGAAWLCIATLRR